MQLKLAAALRSRTLDRIPAAHVLVSFSSEAHEREDAGFNVVEVVHDLRVGVRSTAPHTPDGLKASREAAIDVLLKETLGDLRDEVEKLRTLMYRETWGTPATSQLTRVIRLLYGEEVE